MNNPSNKNNARKNVYRIIRCVWIYQLNAQISGYFGIANALLLLLLR